METGKVNERNRLALVPIVLWALAGIGIGVAVEHYWSGRPQPAAGASWAACFDSDQVNRILQKGNAQGVRFYSATDDGKTLTVLFTGLDSVDGSHVKDEKGEAFVEYQGLQGGRTKVADLKSDEAKGRVKDVTQLNRRPWSADLPKADLEALLGVAKANGLGLRERRATDGLWTFELAPVEITGEQAAQVGDEGDVILAAFPCPTHCPGRDYLQNR